MTADGESRTAGESVDSSTAAGGATDDGADGRRSPATKSSALWGAVGGLSFLVLVQGYELVADPGVGFGAKLLVALVVTAGAAVSAHVARNRLIR